MPDGMFMLPIPRGENKSPPGRTTAKRPIIADVGPEMPGDRFAFGQDRHRRVVAEQPFCSQSVGLDQVWSLCTVQGLPGRPASTR
jgi:hypothetical protein